MAKQAPTDNDGEDVVSILPTRRDALRMGGAALVMAPSGVELVRDAFPRRPGLEDVVRARHPVLGANKGVDSAYWTDAIRVVEHGINRIVDPDARRASRFDFLRQKSAPLPEVYSGFIAGNAGGINGARWSSTFMALANGNEELRFNLKAVPFGSTYDSPASTVPFTLPPGTSKHFDNVIVDGLNLGRFTGTVYVDVESGTGAFESRVINTLSDGTIKGQRSAPMLQQEAILPGEEAFIFTEKPDGFRFNPYFQAWEDADIIIAAQSPDGRTIADHSFSLRAGEATQFVDAYNSVLQMSLGEEPLGIVVQSTGRVSAGGSSIDNLSGDTIWYEASRKPILIGETVAVKNQGANNSDWRRSVLLWNQDPDGHLFHANFFFADGSTIERMSFPMPSRGGVRLDDILDQMGVTDSYGTLMLTSACNEGSHMGGRVYTPGEGGSLGQSMPVFERLDAIYWDVVGRLFGLSNIGKRNNVNLMNTTDPIPDRDATADYRITVMDGDTRHAYKIWEGTLEPREMKQINNVLEKAGYYGSNALIEVEMTNVASGRLQASTSTIENSTNDPTHQPHTVGPHYVEQEYDTEVYIQVLDNGGSYSAVTNPNPEIIKKVFQIGTLEVLVGEKNFVCMESTSPRVDTLGEVIHNYNGLTAAEQQEFSGDRIGFSPFANDSDFDGSPCDADEPDHQYVNLIRLTVTPR